MISVESPPNLRGPRGLAPVFRRTRGAAAAGARAAAPRGLGHRALRCLGFRCRHGMPWIAPWGHPEPKNAIGTIGTIGFHQKLGKDLGKYDEIGGLKWETCGLHHEDVDSFVLGKRWIQVEKYRLRAITIWMFFIVINQHKFLR